MDHGRSFWLYCRLDWESVGGGLEVESVDGLGRCRGSRAATSVDEVEGCKEVERLAPVREDVGDFMYGIAALCSAVSSGIDSQDAVLETIGGFDFASEV
jgi:hypothetical protein